MKRGLRRAAVAASLACAGVVGFWAVGSCTRGNEGELLFLPARPSLTRYWYNDPQYTFRHPSGTKWVVVNGQAHELPLSATDEQIAAAVGMSVREVAALPDYHRAWQRRSLAFLAALTTATLLAVFLTLELLRAAGAWIVRGFRG